MCLALCAWGHLIIRGVAQPGSALGSGPRSREFKSPLPDHHYIRMMGIWAVTRTLGFPSISLHLHNSLNKALHIESEQESRI
jgi:hypothetical protein